jgi:hypothetical protein
VCATAAPPQEHPAEAGCGVVLPPMLRLLAVGCGKGSTCTFGFASGLCAAGTPPSQWNMPGIMRCQPCSLFGLESRLHALLYSVQCVKERATHAGLTARAPGAQLITERAVVAVVCHLATLP